MSGIINKELENNLKHKTKNEKIIISKLETFKNSTRAERCQECGNILKFWEFQHNDTNEKAAKLKFANFCKIKWCSGCAYRKVKEVIRENRSIIQQIENQKKMAYLFLTLTIENPSIKDLKKTLANMSKAFLKMTKYKLFQKAIKGYFRSVEYLGDHTKHGEAHPHYHVILIVNPSYFKDKDYINHEQWTQMWKKALKADYNPIINIKRIKTNQITKTKNGKNKIMTIDTALAEVGKYCVAPLSISKMDNQNFRILDQQTRGIRQYNRGGLFKKIKPQEDYKITDEEWKFIKEYIFRYDEKNKNYKEIEHENSSDKFTVTVFQE